MSRARGPAPIPTAVMVAVLLVCLWHGPGPARPAAAAEPAGKLDLNRASLEEVLALPVPEELARRIVDHRTYVRFFDDIYDLMEVEGMTAAQLQVLKPLVATLPPDPEDVSIARLAASYQQARRYLGQEGANEGLVDEYLDQLRDPVNVNELDLFDLMSYQNVSPVDATNILKARKRLGAFQNSRQLRQAEDLSYWAFRNLRDFVVYSEEEMLAGRPEKVRGSYELRYYDTPYFQDDEEISAEAFRVLEGGGVPSEGAIEGTAYYKPHMTHKLRLDLGQGFKAGVLTHRNYGKESWHETVKGFYGVHEKDAGPFHLKRLYFGNYRVGFGLGLIMDNTDFVLFRKTGYGWNKRPMGVRGDLSRSREYMLTGAAMEGGIGPVHTTFFVSTGRKDGILNPDGSVNSYVLVRPWPDEEFLAGRLTSSGTPTGLTRGAFKEDILGGNVKLMLGTGSYVGVTGYEASYDRPFRADPSTLVMPDNMGLLEARDSEIASAYTSLFVDPVSGERREYRFRRVFGTEFQTVVDRFALQGEYAFLQDPRNPVFDGKNPDAVIINAYTQFEDLNLLAIYRDYDVGFDNPYNRAFSNDTRYEMTLLDAPYRLEDPLYSFLELTTPQPKPERGLFFDARYRISRNLILTGLQYDQWERKADGADLRRWTLKAEYQPIFNLRFRLRQRYSSRSEDLPGDVRAFRNWETRWEVITLLSNYNRLGMGFLTSNVQFPARQRLSFPPDSGPGDSALGLAADPSNVFWAWYEHNLTPWIRLTLASAIYDGFFWTFEGNEFALVDGNGFRNWLGVESRVSERLLLQMKVTRDHNLPRTFLDVRRFGEPYGQEPDATWVPRDDTYFRLQIDYTF